MRRLLFVFKRHPLFRILSLPEKGIPRNQPEFRLRKGSSGSARRDGRIPCARSAGSCQPVTRPRTMDFATEHPVSKPPMTRPVLKSRNHPKLTLLQGHDAQRKWRSLEDKRICLLCGGEFNGHAIRVRIRSGRPRFLCPDPGCSGELPLFARVGNPLLNDSLWLDWMRIEESPQETGTPGSPPLKGQPERTDPEPHLCRQSIPRGRVANA